jgi:hypothetical protein
MFLASQNFSCPPFENYSLPNLKEIISWHKISWDRLKEEDSGKSEVREVG